MIAKNLSVSLGTVKIHVEHILAKLGVTDRTQAAVMSVTSGFLTKQAGGPPPTRD
jgi:DNA-binding NarL/FixJ family response regulator